MSAPRRIIPTTEIDRWGALRAEASRVDNEARESGLGEGMPVLDAIAWLSGFPERDDDRLRLLVEQARAERFTWREIAVASGESNDRGGESRTQARQHFRNQRAGLV